MKKRYYLLNIFLFLITLGLLGQEIRQTKSDPNTPIFEVKNDLGQTVFAVYPGGVHIFIDDSQKKAVGGGFSVGRLSTGKAADEDYFTVYPGDVKVIIPSVAEKAAGGGFSVGRLSTGKATGDEDYLKVTPDSTRVYVSESSNNGFAVGKLGTSGTTDFLNLTPENYFIGHNVAPNIGEGVRNSVLGYNAGNSLVGGDDNIFIGNMAGFSTGSGSIGGNENIFIGNSAGFNSTSPVRNVFIGHEAGMENVTGQYNLYVGNAAGKNGKGFYNTILGPSAASDNDFGNSNVVIGYVAGREMVSSSNVFIGQGAGWNNASEVGGNVFIGPYAGETVTTQDYRLAISSSFARYEDPLIYGEFDNKGVAINASTTNGFTFYVNGSSAGEGAWENPSDLRLKKDILTIPDALTKVLKLRGINFIWKEKEDNKVHMGFIAQEVKQIVPEVVNKRGDTYTMQYAPITALLVEAMKEQQEQIKKLAEENQSLKKQVSEIKKLKDDIEFLKKQYQKEKKQSTNSD